MTLRTIGLLSAACLTVALAVSSSVEAQTADRARGWDPAWEPPRTPWGHPDLQGNWTNATITPLQRREGLGPTLSWEEVAALEREQADRLARSFEPSDPDRPAPIPGNLGTYDDFYFDAGDRVAVVQGEPRSSLITFPPSGRIPALSPRGLDRNRADRELRSRFGPFDHPELRPIAERCIIYYGSSPTGTLGPPMTPTNGYNNNYTIVQNADHVVIMTEMIHDVRIVRLGEQVPLPGHIRPWFGESRGRWDGNTLVVETTQVHPQQRFNELSANRIFHTDLKVTERFTRVDEGTILYEFEIEDPVTYSEPWGGQIPLLRFDDQIFEYACHEGNYALGNILRGGRYQDP
jgi:hypothetical protein